MESEYIEHNYETPCSKSKRESYCLHLYTR